MLDGGQTAHSLFRIPLQIFSDSVYRISVDSDLAQMIKIADCIIWDEAVMAHRHVFMSVERTIRDIMATEKSENNHIPFGNKSILFGGDSRQILPVVKKGNRSAIVKASIKSAPFWTSVQKFQLIENMRIKSAAINHGADPNELNHFSDFLISIGEGRQTPIIGSKFVDEFQLPSGIG